MKDAIKFVTPAFKAGPSFAETDHYIIRNGRIIAFSYALAMSAPFPGVPDCCPRADLFRAAIDKAGDSVGFDLKADALHVRSNGLRVAVPCLTERPFEPVPQGDRADTPSGFLDALRAVQPFMGTDEARPHLKAVHLERGCYSTTNNVTAVQKWTGHDYYSLTIPDYAVNAMLKFKEAPTHIQHSDNDVTFHYDGDRWIKCLFYEGAWPMEQVMKLLGAHDEPFTEMPEGFAAALERLAPFADKENPKVYFRDGGMATSAHKSEGAHVEFAGLPEGLIFGLRPLSLIAPVAQLIRWHPDLRHDFQSTDKTFRGAVMGMTPSRLR